MRITISIYVCTHVRARVCVCACVCARVPPKVKLTTAVLFRSIRMLSTSVLFFLMLFVRFRHIRLSPTPSRLFVPFKPTCLFSTPPRGCSLGQGKPSIWMAPLSTAACHPPLGRQGTVTFPR